ncbi:hypothetical protein Glove_14g60 [Diversispora epigaea]|uniref:HCP-like protein n=1 Tax=Diversispora epigaea TaxID=1348612 RepID=A0A397JRD7_9GLOM|nr:hypothetical protein Glove_14g60 [Diversispora epigaea]
MPVETEFNFVSKGSKDVSNFNKKIEPRKDLYQTSYQNNNNIIIINKIDSQFITKLFIYFIQQFDMQHRPIVHCLIRKYILNSKRNPTKIFNQILQCDLRRYFTSLIGFCYEFGIGTIVDNKLAYEMYISATQDNIENSLGLDGLDATLRSNTTLSVNNIETLLSPIFLKSYRINNHFIGQFCLSSMFYYGKYVKKDETRSFLLLSTLTQEGSVRAQVTLGECYYEGSGIKKDEKKAFKLVASSAKKGNLVGKFLLGYCYQKGIGVEEDIKLGFQWYLEAAEGGNINSMHRVGDCYYDGRGTPKDDKKALEYFIKSAEEGLDVAWTDVGFCHLNGVGTEGSIRDENKAFKYYLKSAEDGSAYGQCKVGLCCIHGLGTKFNIEKAIYWLNKSKENGNTDAERLLSEFIIMLI